MLTTFLSNPDGGLQGGFIALAVVVFFVVRQFTTRPVLSWTSLIAPLALVYFGIQGLSQLDSTGWFVLTASLSVAIALGTLRGTTFRIWTGENGSALMRGNALTLALWAATFAVRIAMAFIENQLGLAALASSTAETLLPAAATFATQSLVVYLRARDAHLIGYRLS